MPFKNNSDLPESVKDNLPSHGQEIYREAFNNAWEHYADPSHRQPGRSQEETAHAVAWDAVKNKYHKNDSGNWVQN